MHLQILAMSAATATILTMLAAAPGAATREDRCGVGAACLAAAERPVPAGDVLLLQAGLADVDDRAADDRVRTGPAVAYAPGAHSPGVSGGSRGACTTDQAGRTACD